MVDKNFWKFEANGQNFEIIGNFHSGGKKSEQFFNQNTFLTS